MSFLNEFYDEIYCVNLDRRTDRWEDAQKEFAKYDIKVKRFSAVDGKTLPMTAQQIINPNEMGCLKSHVAILAETVRKNYDRVLVFEDDIEFRNDPNVRTKQLADYLPEKWEMLYYGGNHVRPLIKDGSLWRATRTFTTSAYAITRDYAGQVVRSIKPNTRQIDVVYANMHPRIKAFVMDPACVVQKAGFSDIQNGYVDYGNLF